MAATSLRQRASALCPTFSGVVAFVKCTPSTTASVLNSNCSVFRPMSNTAQSSPGPTTSAAFAARLLVSCRISSNSFMEPARQIVLIQQHEEISRVENRVRQDGCQQRVGPFIQPGEHKAE